MIADAIGFVLPPRQVSVAPLVHWLCNCVPLGPEMLPGNVNFSKMQSFEEHHNKFV